MLCKNVICFIIGLIIGIRLTDLWGYIKLQKFNVANTSELCVNPIISANKSETHSSNTNKSYLALEASFEENDESGSYDTLKGDDHIEHTSSSSLSSSSLSDYLYNRTRVLCWIMTGPQTRLKRAIHVKNTWGKRCNRLLFMSSQEDPLLDTIKLPVREGREYLWRKTRKAFRYIYEHHFDEADWFLKADDDTYFIMENLRAFLYQHTAKAPVYFGSKFHYNYKHAYMSGGAGYVLSKEALRRFVTIAYHNRQLCRYNSKIEDKEMGICLKNVGVVAGDSRDEYGLERFIALGPGHLIPFDISKWYSAYLFYKKAKNVPCCSGSIISFHYMKFKDFYKLDYFIYKVKVFGTSNALDALPPKLNTMKLIEKWRKEHTNNI